MTRRIQLAWLWTLAIFVLCWIPRAYIPGQEKLPRPLFVFNIDKIVHFGIFAGFSFLWMWASRTPRRPWWVLGAGLALTVITELGQENRFINRDASVADGLADGIGVCAGIVGLVIFERYEAKRRALKTQSAEMP